jgi:hypothetical protein
MHSQIDIKIIEARKARLIRRKVLKHKRRFKLLKKINPSTNCGKIPTSCSPSLPVNQFTPLFNIASSSKIRTKKKSDMFTRY